MILDRSHADVINILNVTLAGGVLTFIHIQVTEDTLFFFK
jgi:hypothetical protein